MSALRVLLVGPSMGFGAREHAIAWLLSQSERVQEVLVLRGNAATLFLPKVRHIHHPTGGKWEIPQIVKIAVQEKVDCVVIGPEGFLVAGLVDALSIPGIRAFGPSADAAKLEGDKTWSARIMRAANIPQPRFWIFYDNAKAVRFARKHSGIVVKLANLHGGKGVWVCKTKQQAEQVILFCGRQYPGEPIVIQELLEGMEVSVFCFTDGYTISNCIAAVDYKPRFEGNRGPNTGSMGSFSPPEWWNKRIENHIVETILQPIVDAMRARGIVYKGVLYAGLMITKRGPKVLEFNCRFGDSEAQVILPLLDTDLVEVMQACIDGTLHTISVEWNRNLKAVTVALVDKEYPESPGAGSGGKIHGLNDIDDHLVRVFHYSTVRVECENGEAYAQIYGGGRRLAVTAVAKTLEEARRIAYEAIGKVQFAGMDYRRDIAESQVLPRELMPVCM